MPLVFKYTLVLLASSFAMGQTWLHNPATAADTVTMVQLVESCPVLDTQADDDRASRYDAIALRDAYWRAKIKDAVVEIAGGESDACSDR